MPKNAKVKAVKVEDVVLKDITVEPQPQVG